MTDNPGDKSDAERHVSRRSYLTAAAAGTAAIIGAGTGAASGDDYEVVKVPAGGTFRRRLGSGDVLENVVIDISARNASYDIQAKGSNWTIRNVGVRGAWDHAHHTSPIRVSADAGSTCRIENVYLGDGVIPNLSPGQNPTGIYVYWYHAGTIEIDRVNLQEHPDNGIYGSAPGNSSDHPNPGSGGQVHVTNSYVRGGKVAGIRLGTDGSYARNCVVWNNAHRGYWGYYGDTKLIDCDFGGSSTDLHAGSRAWRAGPQATVTVENTRFGSTNRARSTNRIIGSSAGKPEHRIPDGAPTSAEEAASGGNYEPPSIEDVWNEDDSNHVEFTGGSSGSIAEYRLSGLGNAEYGDGANTGADDPYRETISTDGDAFELAGYLGGGTDDFHVEGAIEDVAIDGDVTLRINSVSFDPAEVNGVGSWESDVGGASDELENILLVDGVGTSGVTRYEFAVSGEAEHSTDGGASIDDEDAIDGGRVTGAVASWRDAFRFSGELEDLTVDGPARILVNDEQVDPDEYGDASGSGGDEELPPNALVIDGTGTDGETTYSFTVDGDVITSSYRDASIDPDDIIDGQSVSGSVEDSIDAYWFDGDIVDFRLSGNANVDVEYNVRDQ